MYIILLYLLLERNLLRICPRFDTVRVQIFTGYKIWLFLWTVLHHRNFILGYFCARDLEMYVCAHL